MMGTQIKVDIRDTLCRRVRNIVADIEVKQLAIERATENSP